LPGSGRAGRLRLMGKYIGHRLVARPEPDDTFWSDSTLYIRIQIIPFYYYFYLGDLFWNLCQKLLTVKNLDQVYKF